MSRIKKAGLPIFALMASSLGFLSSCKSEPEYPAQAGIIDEGFKADLAALRNRHIYFGHQSVGKNIMEGLAVLLKETGETGFAIADLDAGQTLASGGVAHARIGKNRIPEGKCDVFAKFLKDASPSANPAAPGAAAPYDLAALKFCYLDVESKTDVAGLFAYYKSTLDSVQARNPSLVILYVTVPLKTAVQGRLAGVKRLLGLRDPNDADNIRRNEFNELVRGTFVGKPIFDLAALESTYPDGSRTSFDRDGKTGYRFIGSLSADGGHFNDLGKRVAAKAFVHAMAAALHGR